jgi:AAA domain-containing protein
LDFKPNAFEWYTGEEFSKLPPISDPWAIKELVPLGALTMLFGPPGIGKSAMAWTMGEAIQTGTDFLSDPAFPTTKGNVLLLCADMPKHWVGNRFAEANYTAPFNLGFTGGHFNVVDAKNLNLPMYQEIKQAAAGCSTVLIDSLMAVISGLSVKDDEVPSIVISALRDLFPTQAIVLLHHGRKQSFQGGAPIPPSVEDALGSQFWRSSCQSQLQLYCKPGDMSYFRVAKSQVSARRPDDGVDVYVDEKGCKVIPWTEHQNNTTLATLRTADAWLIANDPAYGPAQLTGSVGKYVKLAAHLGVKEPTIRSWLGKTKFKLR